MTEYIYRLGNGKELCRSESPVTFAEGFPAFSDIEPEKVETKAPAKKRTPKPEDKE